MPGAPTPLGDLAARGPRAHADSALVVEAVHEGWRLHTARQDAPSRVLQTPDDDLALLAGDRLYALGLERLADRGDLRSVTVLTDVIALAARADSESNAELADAAFEAGAVGVGWDTDPALEQAFRAAREGRAGAPALLREAARQVAGEMAS